MDKETLDRFTFSFTSKMLVYDGNLHTNNRMAIFHNKMTSKITSDNRDVMDEDGLAATVGKNFCVYAWPPRVFAETGILSTCSLN